MEQKEMSELLSVMFSSCMCTTFLYQLIGYVSPHWACMWTDGDKGSCELDWLFLPPKKLSRAVLGLNTISFAFTFGSLLGMLILSHKHMKKNEFLTWSIYLPKWIPTEKTELKKKIICVLWSAVFYCFLFGQIVAGVAGIILYTSNDVIGWSAVIFTTLAFPMTGIATSALLLFAGYGFWKCVLKIHRNRVDPSDN